MKFVKLSFAQSFVHAASFSPEVASEPYIHLEEQRFQKREIDVCRECRVPLIHRECRLISTASDLIRLIILILALASRCLVTSSRSSNQMFQVAK